jgi:hypothetical protein
MDKSTLKRTRQNLHVPDKINKNKIEYTFNIKRSTLRNIFKCALT